MKLEYITDPLQPYFMEIIPPWNKDLIYIIGEAAGGGDMTEFEILRNHNQWPQAERAKVVRRKLDEDHIDHWERVVLEAHGLIYDDWLKHITQRARDKQLKQYMAQLGETLENLQRFHETGLDIPEHGVTDDDLDKLKKAMAHLIDAEQDMDDVYSSHGG